ncbi:hypothetical protein COE70_33735, partial [Bacillus cereus]|uniref:Ig-like domain-containing protein n=1 Tax=Bacillus cereus TaxID=1396 RepID=UPI000BFD29C5
VTDVDTTVTGTAKAGSTVSIKVGNQEIGQGQADENGSYNISIPKQPAGTKLSVTASNSAGTSQATEVTVQQKLEAPTINPYYPTEAFARGTAPGASRVGVYIDGNLVRTATVNPNGSYEIYTGDIVSLRTIGNTFEIAAIDANGNESERTKQTVQAKLEAPTVQAYFVSDEAVTGRANGSKVNLYLNDAVVSSATVNDDGTYSIDTSGIADMQVVGTSFHVSTVYQDGTEGPKTLSTVRQRLEAPTINPYYPTEAFARGTAPAGASRVAIYVDGNLIRTTTVNADGSYSIYTGDVESLRTAGNTFEIAAIDADGQVGKKATGIVTERMDSNVFILGTDQFVTGTISSSVTKVKIVVDGQVLRQTATIDGTYKIYAEDLITDTSQKIEIVGYNDQNTELSRTIVQVK